MKKIKLFMVIVISIQLFTLIGLWFLPYDNVYKVAHTVNPILILLTGFLMIKYIYIDGKKRLIVFVRDITVRKQIENELREMSIRDELTKIYNRRYIMKKLKDEFFLSKVNNSTFSIALLDIDNFKRVNDNYGHLFGDEVLIKFSNMVKKNLRKTDYLGRIGGEEFIIIFCNTILNESYEILLRIKEKLNSVSWGKNDFSVTFSAGLFEVSHKNIDEHSSERVIKLIDDLMYKAKKCGKNCIITSTE